MGNGIFEALKIKIFLGSMPPNPPSASRLRRSFSLCFLCVPRWKNHATPLIKEVAKNKRERGEKLQRKLQIAQVVGVRVMGDVWGGLFAVFLRRRGGGVLVLKRRLFY